MFYENAGKETQKSLNYARGGIKFKKFVEIYRYYGRIFLLLQTINPKNINPPLSINSSKPNL